MDLYLFSIFLSLSLNIRTFSSNFLSIDLIRNIQWEFLEVQLLEVSLIFFPKSLEHKENNVNDACSFNLFFFLF